LEDVAATKFYLASIKALIAKEDAIFCHGDNQKKLSSLQVAFLRISQSDCIKKILLWPKKSI